MDMTESTVLITGAAQGIGRAFAGKFAEHGATLILVDRSETELLDFQKLLGGKHKAYVVDLSDPKEIESFVEELRMEHKKLDILLNNAGIGVYKPVADITKTEWMQSYAVNVNAPFLLIQRLVSLLEESKSGVVINVGSKCGVQGIAERTAYCSTKFALRGLSLSLS